MHVTNDSILGHAHYLAPSHSVAATSPSSALCLSHYDRSSSFLVLLDLPADKRAIMEMGGKGFEHHPKHRIRGKNLNSCENYVNRIIWTLDSFKCCFCVLFLISSLIEDGLLWCHPQTSSTIIYGRYTAKHLFGCIQMSACLKKIQ